MLLSGVLLCRQAGLLLLLLLFLLLLLRDARILCHESVGRLLAATFMLKRDLECVKKRHRMRAKENRMLLRHRIRAKETYPMLKKRDLKYAKKRPMPKALAWVPAYNKN